MCWICNPSCGKCKPPIQIVKCLACRAHNLANRKTCKKCGTALPERVEGPAVMCSHSGMMCTNPCNKHKIIPKDGVVMPCSWNTLPGRKSDNSEGR